MENSAQDYRLFLQLGTIPAGAMLATYALTIGGLFAFGALPPHRGVAPDPLRMAWTIFPIMLVACFPTMAAYALFEAAASLVALKANGGAASSFFEANGAVLARFGRIVWLMILRCLCIMFPVAVLFSVIGAVAMRQAFADGPNLNPRVLFVAMPIMMLAYVGSIVYGIWMALHLCLAVPVCLAEGKVATRALRRSAQLTRGSKGRIFLVMLVVYAISFAAILVLELAGVILSAVVLLIGSGLHIQLTQPWAGVGFGILALVILGAYLLIMTLSWASYAITFSVLYDDQRLRMEGLAPAAMSGGSA